MDPFWGGGGFGLQHGHFSVKMYAKMKELGPVGGRAPARPPDPPMLISLFSLMLNYAKSLIIENYQALAVLYPLGRHV